MFFVLDVVFFFFIQFTALAEPANVAQLTNVEICCQIHVICWRARFLCVLALRAPSVNRARMIGYYSHEPNRSYISLKRNQAVDSGVGFCGSG